MPPLIKVILLCLAAVAHRIAVNPPNPPPTKNDRISDKSLLALFEKSPRMMGLISQVSSIGCMMIECILLLALYFRSPGAFSNLCPASSQSLSDMSTLSPIFLFGIGLMYTAAFIRVSCYKALGTLFTYEITIRPNHQLITSGPYAYVRHPGYTGSACMLTGTMVVCLGPHSYISSCDVASTPVRWITYTWAAFMIYAIVGLLGRGKTEDEGLKKEFGESWEKYRHAVPYRFIPGIV